MEQSTIVGHMKWSGIAYNPIVLEWAGWWVVCSAGVISIG